MPDTKLFNRDEIDQKYKWNAESVFSNTNELEVEFAEITALLEKIKELRGRLNEGPQVLLQALNQVEEIIKRAGNVYMFTYMAFKRQHT
jgi:oligoendopeptidase F